LGKGRWISPSRAGVDREIVAPPAPSTNMWVWSNSFDKKPPGL